MRKTLLTLALTLLFCSPLYSEERSLPQSFCETTGETASEKVDNLLKRWDLTIVNPLNLAGMVRCETGETIRITTPCAGKHRIAIFSITSMKRPEKESQSTRLINLYKKTSDGKELRECIERQ